MARLLKILAWGLAIWGLSLLWPTSSLVLTPATMIWLTIGLGLIVIAYFTGQYVGQTHSSGENKATRKAFHAHRTRPTPIAHVRSHFSRRTAPMPAVVKQSPASRPTRPIPLAR
jgi:hypothetical protein